MFDYDNDGWIDIFQANGSMLDNIHLYHSEVFWKEGEPEDRLFPDVTEHGLSPGLYGPWHIRHSPSRSKAYLCDLASPAGDGIGCYRQSVRTPGLEDDEAVCADCQRPSPGRGERT